MNLGVWGGVWYKTILFPSLLTPFPKIFHKVNNAYFWGEIFSLLNRKYLDRWKAGTAWTIISHCTYMYCTYIYESISETPQQDYCCSMKLILLLLSDTNLLYTCLSNTVILKRKKPILLSWLMENVFEKCHQACKIWFPRSLKSLPLNPLNPKTKKLVMFCCTFHRMFDWSTMWWNQVLLLLFTLLGHLTTFATFKIYLSI